MAKFSTDLIIANRIDQIYSKLYKTKSKLNKAASRIGFIKQNFYNKVAPRFARINGKFINKQDQVDAEQKLMLLHLSRHVFSLK